MRGSKRSQTAEDDGTIDQGAENEVENGSDN